VKLPEDDLIFSFYLGAIAYAIATPEKPFEGFGTRLFFIVLRIFQD